MFAKILKFFLISIMAAVSLVTIFIVIAVIMHAAHVFSVGALAITIFIAGTVLLSVAYFISSLYEKITR